MTLDRFIEAQEKDYDKALSEIAKGHKESHWMWYIFPQLKGLGRSYMADYYGIDGIEEAKEYWSDYKLQIRLKAITFELLNHTDKTAIKILGETDAKKLESCMTLFEYISDEPVFSIVLDEFFEGERDEVTLKMLKEETSDRRLF